MTQYLDFYSEGVTLCFDLFNIVYNGYFIFSEDNEEDADEDKFIFGCCDGQNWSYNPSYDGKR